MCGRYASTRSAADLAALFGAQDLTDLDLVPSPDPAAAPAQAPRPPSEWPRSYNIAPTDPAPTVVARAGPGAAALRVGRWGFLPPWAPDASGAARMINARAETVTTSRAFSEAFARRRCLIPVDGWYEWRGNGGKARTERARTRAPFYMTHPDPVVFGGVWSAWGSGDQRHITFSIITMAAIGELATVHHRMPLLLDESRWDPWLYGSGEKTLLTPPTSEYCAAFEIRPVSVAVGDVRKDGPELVRSVTAESVDLSIVDRAPTLF